MHWLFLCFRLFIAYLVQDLVTFLLSYCAVHWLFCLRFHVTLVRIAGSQSKYRQLATLPTGQDAIQKKMDNLYEKEEETVVALTGYKENDIIRQYLAKRGENQKTVLEDILTDLRKSVAQKGYIVDVAIRGMTKANITEKLRDRLREHNGTDWVKVGKPYDKQYYLPMGTDLATAHLDPVVKKAHEKQVEAEQAAAVVGPAPKAVPAAGSKRWRKSWRRPSRPMKRWRKCWRPRPWRLRRWVPSPRRRRRRSRS